jgi:hypothetical protein
MTLSLVDRLKKLLSESDVRALRKRIASLQTGLRRRKQDASIVHLQRELEQILDAQTMQRAQYYLRRLIKGQTEVKTGKLNDLNLNRWKEYGDILTDSLWLEEKRDRSGTHSADYWGNFIPQIPSQLIRRYTKPGEWVLDPFLGSGTTLIECKRLGRNGIGVELQPSIAKKTGTTLHRERAPHGVRAEVLCGDSAHIDLRRQMQARHIPSAQLAILHPPYWDIIRFSGRAQDLSNAPSLAAFVHGLGRVVETCASVLDAGRYLALVIGDKYSEREWIPLGFLSMQEVQAHGFLLKSIIVKNFNRTKGKRNQEELWRYRALVGGFYVFKHEYIFLFQKK